MKDFHAPQSFPVCDSVAGCPHDVFVSAHARTLYVPVEENVYEPERPVEAFAASEETELALTMARVVVMPLSAIWKMFGKFVAVALPMFEAEAENEVATPVVGDADTEVAPAVKSGSAGFATEIFTHELQPPPEEFEGTRFQLVSYPAQMTAE